MVNLNKNKERCFTGANNFWEEGVLRRRKRVVGLQIGSYTQETTREEQGPH